MTSISDSEIPVEVEDFEVVPPERELSPVFEPLEYLVGVRNGLRTKKFANYAPAQIEQLDRDLKEARHWASIKYKNHADISAFLFNQHILIALKLLPLKIEKKYGEYLHQKWKVQYDDAPVTKRDRK